MLTAERALAFEDVDLLTSEVGDEDAKTPDVVRGLVKVSKYFIHEKSSLSSVLTALYRTLNANSSEEDAK